MRCRLRTRPEIFARVRSEMMPDRQGMAVPTLYLAVEKGWDARGKRVTRQAWVEGRPGGTVFASEAEAWCAFAGTGRREDYELEIEHGAHEEPRPQHSQKESPKKGRSDG